MNLAAQPYLQQANLHGMDDVMLALERLSHDLPAAQLGLLKHFNDTYLVITRNVRQARQKGLFQHPDFLERFDARFGYYYFQALRHHLSSEPTLTPTAWRRAFGAAHKGKASPLIIMALGVNAHVNNDIPQVLRDSGAEQRHRRDYNLVNGIIGGSLDEIIDQFKGTGQRFNPAHRLLRPLYKTAMRLLVHVWRFNAWHKFQRLSTHPSHKRVIERGAADIAAALHKLPL